MANAIVKVYTTVAAKLSQLAVSDGQLIFVSDTRRIYLDFNGYRIGYDTFRVFDTDQDRLQWLAPVEGFYFVRSTGVLWNYEGSWKQLTPSNLEQVVIGESASNFPTEGDPKTLYAANSGVYRWDASSNQYGLVANKLEWGDL